MGKTDKIRLRNQVRAELKNLSPLDIQSKSLDVLTSLFSFLFQRKIKGVLGVFAPLQDEVQWTLREEELTSQWDLAFPGIESSGEMSFRQCAWSDLVSTKEFGLELKTPPQQVPVVLPVALLVPGLAFSPGGGRLGRGKGFYDRYLADYKGLKIGICFKEQLREIVPTEPFDCAMDFVVSEKKVFEKGTEMNITEKKE